MNLSPVVSASGEPIFAFGGNDVHDQGVHKGFQWTLEWMKSGRQIKRVLCIAPYNPFTVIGAPVTGVWVIAHTDAFNYYAADRDNKITGTPTKYAIEQAVEGLAVMGRDPMDKAALSAVLDIVMKHAEKLVSNEMIPPKHVVEKLQGEAMWEMTTFNRADGKTIREDEA